MGNSVSLSPLDGVPAYHELLAESLAGAQITRLIRSGTTVDEMEDEIVSAIERHRPTVLTLQVGINECAPRPLGRRGRALLSRLRPVWVRQRIIGLLHRYRPQIIRFRGVLQFTSPGQFTASVTRVIDAAVGEGARVIVLPITRVTSTAELRTPYLNEQVERFNLLLSGFRSPGVVVLDEGAVFGSLTPDDYCAEPTTVHLGAEAHRRLAVVLRHWIAREHT